MIHFSDGTLLIQAAIDGPFVEVESHRSQRPVRAESADPSPIDAKQLSTQARQAVIKAKIKELQDWDKTLSFANAWAALRATRPDLFD